MTETEPQPAAPEDEMLLQESDAPESPAVLLVDLSSNRASDLAHEPSRARPGPHQPAHGSGRAVPGGGSSARGDLLRLKIIIPQGCGPNL